MSFKPYLHRLSQGIPSIISLLFIIFALTYFALYQGESVQVLSFKLSLDLALLALAYSLIICLPHSVTCCFLGDIMQNITRRRVMHYYLGNLIVFMLIYLVGISIWKWVPYFISNPAASDIANPPAFFTAFDSWAYFLRYGVLHNLMYAAEFSLIFTLLMLVVYYVRYQLKRLFS